MWGGSSRFITILHGGGGLPNLLQYYIGGFFKVYYNITDLVGIWKGSGHFQYYIYFYVVLKIHILSQIWNFFGKYAILGKYAKIISIFHMGDFPNLLQYYMGGSSQFITILQ